MTRIISTPKKIKVGRVTITSDTVFGPAHTSTATINGDSTTIIELNDETVMQIVDGRLTVKNIAIGRTLKFKKGWFGKTTIIMKASAVS